MPRRVLLLACVSACGFSNTVGGADDTNQFPTGDATTSCMGWVQMPTDLDPCGVPAPTSELTACADATLDTTDGTWTGTPPFATTVIGNRRIVSVTQLEVCAGSTLTIVGSRPLVIVAHDRADVLGILDASARGSGDTWDAGPGGDACTMGEGRAGTGSSGGSGGGGGAGFGAAGGVGGTSEAGGGAAGMPEGMATISPLRGGCAGGKGGDGDNSGSGGAGGRGGGAIQLAARNELVVTGSVRASGGPGLGGSGTDAGGGGGGSGGAILLESAVVDVRGAACANGGGGGGGANDGGPFLPGGRGTAGHCANMAAAGGPGGNNNGRPGGAGGFATTNATGGMGADEGAGGGGGATGRIRIRAAMPKIAGTITPPAM